MHLGGAVGHGPVVIVIVNITVVDVQILVAIVSVGLKVSLATGAPSTVVKISAVPKITSVEIDEDDIGVVLRDSIAADADESYINQLLMQ